MSRTWKHAADNRKPLGCEYCGQIYQPVSSTQRWCDECAPNRFYMNLIRMYGLNKKAFRALIISQGGKCAICAEPFSPNHDPGVNHEKPYPCLDHDHDTGRLRGLLCLRCNTRLGGKGSERIWLNAAMKYLDDHEQWILLDPKDPTAQDLLWEYAQRRRAVDAEFSDDLETALRDAGHVPDRAIQKQNRTRIEQAAAQCEVVAYLATSLAQIHRDHAELFNVGQLEVIAEQVGRRTAYFMEVLGDFLNGMDAVSPEDAKYDDVFEEAQRLWPSAYQPQEPGEAP